MARKMPVPEANQKVVLNCIHQNCPSCGQKMWSDYDNLRTIRTLSGIVRMTLKIRRCSNQECQRYHQVYRPEEEGGGALPGHEFGRLFNCLCRESSRSRTQKCATNSRLIKRKGSKYLSSHQAGVLKWVTGDRSQLTFNKLWGVVRGWQCFLYITDGWKVYPCFINDAEAKFPSRRRRRTARMRCTI